MSTCVVCEFGSPGMTASAKEIHDIGFDCNWCWESGKEIEDQLTDLVPIKIEGIDVVSNSGCLAIMNRSCLAVTTLHVNVSGGHSPEKIEWKIISSSEPVSFKGSRFEKDVTIISTSIEDTRLLVSVKVTDGSGSDSMTFEVVQERVWVPWYMPSVLILNGYEIRHHNRMTTVEEETWEWPVFNFQTTKDGLNILHNGNAVIIDRIFSRRPYNGTCDIVHDGKDVYNNGDDVTI